jgi:hypothetical protein
MRRKIYTTHTLGDPALARMTPTEVVRYAASRDPADLGELCGVPMSFHFRRLTRAQLFDFVDTTTSEMRRAERAFMAGIVRIEGGEFTEAWTPEGVDGRTHVAMTGDELEALGERGIAPAVSVDVGSVIYLRSLLDPKAAPRYVAPPSSLAAWDALPRPSADASPAERHPSNGEPSAARA